MQIKYRGLAFEGQFYYIREESTFNEETRRICRGAPIATVCLLKDTKSEKWARGVALCSVIDQPKKQIGRALALSRAAKALLNQEKLYFTSYRYHGGSLSLNMHYIANYPPLYEDRVQNLDLLERLERVMEVQPGEDKLPLLATPEAKLTNKEKEIVAPRKQKASEQDQTEWLVNPHDLPIPDPT